MEGKHGDFGLGRWKKAVFRCGKGAKRWKTQWNGGKVSFGCLLEAGKVLLLWKTVRPVDNCFRGGKVFWLWKTRSAVENSFYSGKVGSFPQKGDGCKGMTSGTYCAFD